MTTLTLAAMAVASMAAQDSTQSVRTLAIVEPSVIEISGQLVRAGDRSTISAGRVAPYGGRQFVWTDTGCTVMVSDREPEKTPAAGWRVTALVRGGAGEAVDIDVDWERLWDRGARLNEGLKGSVRAVWRPGDRIEIDRIDPASGPCGLTGVRLQVTVSRAVRASDQTAPSRALSSVVTSGARGGGGGGGGRGGGGSGRGGAGAIGGATTSVPAPVFASRAQLPRFDAQLWLIHTGPDGKESGQGRSIRFAPAGSGFSFAAEPVQASFGSANVIVMGTISARMGTDDKPIALIVTLQRTVTGGEPAVPTTSGSTTKEIPWADIGGVISFELPAAPGTGQDLLPGHRFAVRVKVGG